MPSGLCICELNRFIKTSLNSPLAGLGSEWLGSLLGCDPLRARVGSSRAAPTASPPALAMVAVPAPAWAVPPGASPRAAAPHGGTGGARAGRFLSRFAVAGPGRRALTSSSPLGTAATCEGRASDKRAANSDPTPRSPGTAAGLSAFPG